LLLAFNGILKEPGKSIDIPENFFTLFLEPPDRHNFRPKMALSRNCGVNNLQPSEPTAPQRVVVFSCQQLWPMVGA
jgi:hypothetical protein